MDDDEKECNKSAVVIIVFRNDTNLASSLPVWRTTLAVMCTIYNNNNYYFQP